MSNQILEYCARAVIQHLNGDMREFNRYKHKAMRAYERQREDEGK